MYLMSFSFFLSSLPLHSLTSLLPFSLLQPTVNLTNDEGFFFKLSKFVDESSKNAAESESINWDFIKMYLMKLQVQNEQNNKLIRNISFYFDKGEMKVRSCLGKEGCDVM